MQADRSARTHALERLEVFVGEWTEQVSFPNAPPLDLCGTAVFEWTLDTRFLLQRSEWPHPDFPDGDGIHWEHDFDLTYTKVR